jgi:hypothetical protein
LGIIITVLSYPADISHDPADAASNFASGLAVTGTICALLFLIPVVGWLMTRNHLPDIIRELKKRLELLEEPVVYSISSHPSPSPRAVGLPKE